MTPANGSHPIVIRTERGLTVSGTRLTLYTLMDFVKAGWPPKLIEDWFDLTDDQIHNVMSYIELHRDEVETEYRQVLQGAAEVEQYWREYNREHLARIAALPPKPGQEELKAKLKAWKRASGIAA